MVSHFISSRNLDEVYTYNIMVIMSLEAALVLNYNILCYSILLFYDETNQKLKD